MVTLSPYFDINRNTGVVTLLKDAQSIIKESGSYTFQLRIRAYENRMTDAESGGGGLWADDAYVNVSIADWSVNRNKTAGKAQVLPRDGCTLSDLAEVVGLNATEVLQWLTIRANEEVELWDGTHKLSQYVTATDVLASSTRSVFSVPNVIFAVWGYDISHKETMRWSQNKYELGSLGFKVVTFENSRYQTSVEAKATFMDQLTNLSTLKDLHGVYLIGHGSLKPALMTDNEGSTVIIDKSCFSTTSGYDGLSGPVWSIEYHSSAAFNNADQSTWGINHALNYKLGAFIGHACFTEDVDARALCSANGLFWGFHGIVNSNDTIVIAASLWGIREEETGLYTIGGLQKTSKIYHFSRENNNWIFADISPNIDEFWG